MKFGAILDSYIRMRNAQHRKSWRKEITLTVKFVTDVDKLSNKKQIEFLSYMFYNNIYQKGIITLLSEKQCDQDKDLNVNSENIPIMLDFHQEKV